MAIADFGGTVLGRPVSVLTADHQNKPDVGASKFREWADQNGLSMLIGGSNTGVNIAMSKVAGAKKVPIFVVGAGGSSLTNEDCNPYTVHYGYDTTSLANGTATTIVKAGGKTWFYLTADYAFGTQLQSAASKVVEANGGKNLGAVRVPLGSLGLLLVPAAGAGIRRQRAGARQCRRGFQQLAEGGQRVRHHQDHETGGAARVHQQHPRPRARDRAGPVPDDRLVLGPQCRYPRLCEALFRPDEGRTHDGPRRGLFRDADLAERGQGRGNDRPGPGHGGAEKGPYQRYVHASRLHTRRRGHGPRHVRDAGQEPAGVEVSLGLLQDREDHAGRGGLRTDHRAVPATRRKRRRNSKAP